MSEQVNEQELVAYIAERTKVDSKKVQLVLKHEQTFINNAQADKKGEVDIDSDELVDYILAKRDVGLNELQVEEILDLEMEYLMDKGLAGYVD
ncbi:hypothetical protein I6N90_20430 [Paenibacillus sp. GSMTC-2017]|uniref:hypothetical protein n=1 Tax=Paenibacillus sp. GSMTC-2017 TaxID=2794350 RepID=UPI0018D75AA1|nr:hypothetical protein [Paenibacillus sp. GSMTC-2017]MBH5320176.1 hypothetical protein [Paenibacillus sp. GSMTC-2017]